MSVTNLTASGTAASHLNYIIKYDKIKLLLVFMAFRMLCTPILLV